MTLEDAAPGAGSAARVPAAPLPATAALPAISRVRWVQLGLGILCMAMIANLQYGWTLFVDPIGKANHWDRASVQFAFTIFVITETWLVPVKSWFVDRYGPRPVIALGATLIATAWVLNSIATTLPMLYLGAGVGGFGAAAIYGTCVGNALKWFPDKRGLAAGATAAGFGAGAALTVVPISNVIATSGYRNAFFWFGIGQGLIVLAAGMFLHAPNILHPAKQPRLRIPQSKRNFKPALMVRQPVFWLLYVCFVMVAAGGLMTAAQIAPIAADYGIAKSPVALAGLTFGALTLALSLDRILDGVGRPLFGLLSDRIGRENTMAIAFSFGALMLLLLGTQGREPAVFVAASAFYFLVFGEIYSLFPATCGDTFGPKFAATNAGLLYTAKGTAALLVPLASLLAKAHGWQAVFYVTVALNIGAALIALLVLRPIRARFIADTALMR